MFEDFLLYTTIFECKTKQIRYNEIFESFQKEKLTDKIQLELKTNKKSSNILKIEIAIYKDNFNKETPYIVEIKEFKDLKIIEEYSCKMKNESSLINNLSKLIKNLQEK